MNKKQEKRFNKATKILDSNDNWLHYGTVSWFSYAAMQYLAKTLGDFHVEYLDTDAKWCISSCYEEGLWIGWKRSKSLTDVLAKAVVAADKKKQKQKKR